MSDAKIKDFMTNDPQASKFLGNMLPGADVGVGGAGVGGSYEGAGRSKENSIERDDNTSKQRQGGQIKIRNVKVNHM